MVTITEAEIIQILLDWSPYFSQSNLIMYLLRVCGWLFVKGLVRLCNACESMLNSFYGTLNFFADDSVQSFISSFKPVIWILFGISLIMLFYMIILKGKNERSGVLINILLAILIVTSLPTVMNEVNNLTYAGISFVRSSGISTGEQIVQSNVDDLLLINEFNFDEEAFKNNTVTNADGIEYKAGNRIATENIMSIDVSEDIDPSKLEKKDYKAVFENMLLVNVNGSQMIGKIPSPPLGISFLSSYYFRYHINWLPIFISLISMIIAVFFTGYKTVRLTFELAVFEFMAPLIAVTDIGAGERIKQVLRAIFSTYAVLFFTSALLKLYMFAVYFFNSALADAPFAMAFAQLFTAIAVIDGPNLFERIFGIDIGLSSGIRNTVAVLHGTKIVAQTVAKTAAAPFKMFSRLSSRFSSPSHVSSGSSGSGASSGGTYGGSSDGSSSGGNHNPPPGTTGDRRDNTGVSTSTDNSVPSGSSSPASSSSSTASGVPENTHTASPSINNSSSPTANNDGGINTAPRDSMNSHMDAARKDVDRILSPSSQMERRNNSPFRRSNNGNRKDGRRR